MSKAPENNADLMQLQASFVEDVLPRVIDHAHVRFRHLRGDNRDDAVAMAMGNAWKAYSDLCEQGKLTEENIGGVIKFAVSHVKVGRDVTGQSKAKDVLARRHGKVVEQLDCGDGSTERVDALSKHGHMAPSRWVPFKMDYETWVEKLKPRQRQAVDMLVDGNTADEVRAELRVSRPRISQIRKELADSWRDYQGTSRSR